MMNNEIIRASGRLHIRLCNADGSLKEERIEDNLVVTVGLEWIAQRIDDATDPADMSHMACGTGTTSPVVGDTALETELARVALSSTGVSGAITTYNATFGAGTGTGALTELGVLNAGAGGTMLSRVTFSVINKAAADIMTVAWAVTIT